MAERWRVTTLGDVADVVGGGTPSTKEPRYWGGDIPWVTPSEITGQPGRLIFDTERRLTAEGLSSSGAKLLPKGTVLLTSRATVGAVAIAGRELATNQGFASLVPGSDVSSEFLMLWCQAHRSEFLARAAGNTFLEISKSNVKTIPIAVPPPGEQRRIVDLVAAIDRLRRRLDSVAEAARVALEHHLDTLSAEGSRALGAVATMGSGVSWTSDQETEMALEGATPVISIANTKPDGRLDLATRRYVSGLPPTTRRLTDASLIMIRTNGNRRRIGNVYRSTPEAVGCAVSAFQIAVEPIDPGDSAFVFWSLAAPRIQRLITESASGTTGLGNIAVRRLRELTIAWPDATARARHVALAESLEAVRRRAEDQRSAAEHLRAGVLAELLSQEHRLPDSYDAVLDS